ncbi:hypothetical protein J6590_028592 [Homalodisca vitripennis]|nr:hypothetical protein J6590_028592 [Homalodisca vitripennis]
MSEVLVNTLKEFCQEQDGVLSPREQSEKDPLRTEAISRSFGLRVALCTIEL